MGFLFPLILLVVFNSVWGNHYTTVHGVRVELKRFYLPGLMTMAIVARRCIRPKGDRVNFKRPKLHPAIVFGIVAATIPELRLKLRGMVESGVRDLVIDLATVRMVDSSGIGLLVSAHNSLRKVGGQLAVIHASGDLLELFHSMRMHQHFPVSGNGGVQ